MKKQAQKIQNRTYQVPFYGLKGSIKEIKEIGNELHVTRYGPNGEDGEKLITPKKYEEELKENIIDDIKKYLEKNDTEYLVSKNNLIKEEINIKNTLIKTSVLSSIAFISLLGTIFTTKTPANISMIVFITSFIASCCEANTLKKYQEDEKRQNFIHQYDNYQHIINEYNLRKDKVKNKEQTSYKGLIDEETNNKIIDIELKKILSKKSA